MTKTEIRARWLDYLKKLDQDVRKRLESATPETSATYRAFVAGLEAGQVSYGAADNTGSTPSSRWHVSGDKDPHAGSYDCERAKLSLGQYSDDELANGAFLNYDNRHLDIHRILANEPGYHSPIMWMTAVKDRIRWLSRKLEEAEQKIAQLSKTPSGPIKR